MSQFINYKNICKQMYIVSTGKKEKLGWHTEWLVWLLQAADENMPTPRVGGWKT